MTEKKESTFFLQYAVAIRIEATPELIWEKLTNVDGFTKWNSTVQSIEGKIAVGERLTIRVPMAPGRAFKPKVAELLPRERMVWRDGFYPMFEGTRTFTLNRRDAGTEFRMVEAFRGVMLPLIKGSLPDFGPVFDRYAADLKAVCER